MNMHSLVSGPISVVNPQIVGQLKSSIGLTTGPSGRRTPGYDAPVSVYLQVQPLSAGDIQKLDGLNLQGTMRKIFMYGRVDGLVRPRVKSGDLFTIAAGVNEGVWLINQVLEQWPDWVMLAVTLQNGA